MSYPVDIKCWSDVRDSAHQEIVFKMLSHNGVNIDRDTLGHSRFNEDMWVRYHEWVDFTDLMEFKYINDLSKQMDHILQVEQRTRLRGVTALQVYESCDMTKVIN
eukprot:CAMPEP_0182438110 /NCGR_PEP_ID=MMETSP1167-20130531/85522_1 /TAXON_ID=2988 /ORGANISM="Mallomonas Sp, Strain CCMP3275" /LENGTH=104 /DNA_ID=CAMNT_0024631307 /DNA_START=694 /DNA_END=1008 /DNA_ORIENTATION=-